MNKSFLFIFFLLANSFSAFANTSQQSGLDIKDQWIFDETFEQCSHYSAHFLGGYLNKNNLQAFILSTGQSLNLLISNANEKEITRYAENSFLSDYTIDRLRSEGFTQALLQCFPGKPNQRERFVLSMIAGDILGKVPTVVTSIYFFRASSSAMSLLMKKFPLLSKLVSAATLAAIALEATIQIRKAHLENSLTPEETKRVNEIRQSFEIGHETRKADINELGAETRKKLIEKINYTTDLQKKITLQKVLEELDQNLKLLNSK